MHLESKSSYFNEQERNLKWTKWTSVALVYRFLSFKKIHLYMWMRLCVSPAKSLTIQDRLSCLLVYWVYGLWQYWDMKETYFKKYVFVWGMDTARSFQAKLLVVWFFSIHRNDAEFLQLNMASYSRWTNLERLEPCQSSNKRSPEVNKWLSLMEMGT